MMRRAHRLRCSRTVGAVAALVVAVAVAGCGSSGSTPPPASAAPAATTGAGAFDPALVPTTKSSTASTSGKTSSPPKSTAKGASTTTTASNAAQALALSSGATPTTSTPPAATTTPAPATTTTKTVYKTSKPKIDVVTVVKYATKYLTKTVTVAPKVPAGAFLPSTHPPLSLTSFKVASGSVGCSIGGGSVRCDVADHSWTAPAQPASCTQSWGTGVVLVNSSGAHPPQFACGGPSALRAGAKVVRNGYDDTVGGITCQVRGFGVDCFATDTKGFILSPTGYILY
jgi:hypothetical protein